MRKYLRYVVTGALILTGLYCSSLYSYLLFHYVAEIFSTVIACAVFLIAWNTRRISENHFLLFLGTAYLFVGSLDVSHTLTYKGMNIFGLNSADVPTQIWIAARYLESFSLLVAPVFIRRKFNFVLLFSIYAAIVATLLMSIAWGNFPACYLEGTGLTPFKKVSEYIICIILLGSIGMLMAERRQFDRSIRWWVTVAIVLTIFSELSFTWYTDPYGISNFTGHIFKILSYWCLYKAIVETSLQKPFGLLFKELSDSKEHYQSLFWHMSNAFARHRMLYDDSGHPVDFVYLEVNPAFEALLGLKKEAVIGKKVTAVFPEIRNDPFNWVEKFGEVAQTGEAVKFEQFAAPLAKWFSISAYSQEKGHFVTVFEDITERKNAELAIQKDKGDLEIQVQQSTDELLKTKALLESIVSHIPVMLCIHSPDGQISYLNEAFQKTLGWDLASAAQTDMLNALFSDAAVRQEVRASIQKLSSGWRDLVVRTRDNREIETSWADVKLSDRSQLAIGIDVSQRKKIERRLKHYMDRLERSNKDLEEFAFIASHDLKEPLRKINFFTGILTEKYALDKTERDAFERIRKAIERMQGLIDSLLTYSRVNTQGAPFAALNLNHAVDAALSNLELLIKESGGFVQVETLPVVTADRIQMIQLFQNLIGNALKFGRTKTTPRIRVYAGALSPDIARNGRVYQIFVQDNGPGFDDRHLKHIFQPFYRLPEKNQYEGAGIGLAICQKIVERHGGAITARSKPGEGATFIITLKEKPEREKKQA